METQIQSAQRAPDVHMGSRAFDGGLIDKTLQHLKDYAVKVEQASSQANYQQNVLASKGIGAKLNKAV